MRRFNPASLDALNFLLADVRGTLGPYLNVYLVTERHWDQAAVGFVTMIGGLLGLVVQTPLGAVIDATWIKRGLVVAALLVLSFGAATIWVAPDFRPVTAANAAVGCVGGVFGPAAALTLGLVARPCLAGRLGRNSAFDHAGNVAIAIVAGIIGRLFSQRAVFLLMPVFAVFAALAVLSIPAKAIDHARARGADGEGQKASSGGFEVLFGCRPLLLYAGCTLLFHLANAALLPLVGQKLAFAEPRWATAMMSACIGAAQLIMLPIALVVGRNADRWGRRPILLVGFGILPLRAALYTLSDSASRLLAVQLLDGVGAGIFGAITPLLLADPMRGSGRYNAAQGVVATAQGIGASMSGVAAGIIVDGFGYSPAFLTSSAVAATAIVVLAAALPETARPLPPPEATALPLRAGKPGEGE